MTVLAAALVVVFLISQAAIVAAFLVARDRVEQRFAAEREADRAERQLLLQRIQAPDVAVAQHAQEHIEDPGFVAPTDDEAYWELQAA